MNQSDVGAECDDLSAGTQAHADLIFDRRPGASASGARAPVFPRASRDELIEECRDCRGDRAGVGRGPAPRGGGSRGQRLTERTDSACKPRLEAPRDQRVAPGACTTSVRHCNVSLDRLAALVVLRSIVNAEEGTFGRGRRRFGSAAAGTGAGVAQTDDTETWSLTLVGWERGNHVTL